MYLRRPMVRYTSSIAIAWMVHPIIATSGGEKI